MVIPGRIQNGVVALLSDISLPDGTEVTVLVPARPQAADEVLPEAEHRRILEIMDRIAALPIEGPDEPFSGADHDKVVYGNP